MRCIDGKEPTHARILVLQIPRRGALIVPMNDVPLKRPEHKMQHVIEMHADVRRHAPGFLDISLPGLKVPMAARSDVGEGHVMLPSHADFLNRRLEADNARMKSQLQ